MKKFLILTFTLLITTFINAQGIPNGGFEQWGAVDPVDWVSSNAAGMPIFITQSQEMHSGAFAVKMTIQQIQGIPVWPVLSTGSEGQGFPVNQRHTAVNFYYKFHKTTETAFISFAFASKKGEELGVGAVVKAIFEPTEAFTLVSLPITYVNEEIPDLATIVITVGDQNNSAAAAGSYAIIDDITFGAVLDVEDEINPKEFKLKQNFPNPFNPSTKIEFNLPAKSDVKLKIFNILGIEVASLLNQELSEGNHSVEFNAANLPSGTYFYRIEAGNFIETKKMILLK